MQKLIIYKKQYSRENTWIYFAYNLQIFEFFAYSVYICKNKTYFLKMSYIQLSYGVVEKTKKSLNWIYLPILSQMFFIFKPLYVVDVKISAFQNSIINVISNREDLLKFLLATNDFGQNTQENINLIVPDGTSNDAAVCHASDPTYKNILQQPNLLEV